MASCPQADCSQSHERPSRRAMQDPPPLPSISWVSWGLVVGVVVAGGSGIDKEVMRGAQIDGADAFKVYRRFIIPQLGPAFLSAVVVLAPMAIKSYELVIGLTGGGPGNATELP